MRRAVSETADRADHGDRNVTPNGVKMQIFACHVDGRAINPGRKQFRATKHDRKPMKKIILILLGAVLVGLAALASVKADCDTQDPQSPNKNFFE